jgi:DNA invertase Pin-like site-specific DNA recombinase
MTKPIVRKQRCAIYTRKSSEEGLEQAFNSLHAQREACEAYIASQRSEGWVLVRDQYDDGGLSGGTLERAGLKRLLEDIEDGLVDVVVVYKIDRLSRSLADFAKLVEVFDRNGVTFVSVTQSFNTTTSMGRLTLNILLSFAQFEREVTAERIRDKVAASRKKGMWMGGVPPYGYRVENRKLVVDEERADHVRWIFARFLEIGSGTELAREVGTRGIRTTRGNRIDKKYIYRILNNRAYIGEAVHKGDSYPGEHDAIIDRETWDRVHAILKESPRKRAARTRANTPALLKGVLFGPDRAAFSPTHTRKGGRLYRYYVSQTVLKHGAGTCPVGRVPAGEIEAAVIDRLRAVFRQPEIVAGTWKAARAHAHDITEADARAALQQLDPLWTNYFPPSRPASWRCWLSAWKSARTGSMFDCAWTAWLASRARCWPAASRPHHDPRSVDPGHRDAPRPVPHREARRPEGDAAATWRCAAVQGGQHAGQGSGPRIPLEADVGVGRVCHRRRTGRARGDRVVLHDPRPTPDVARARHHRGDPGWQTGAGGYAGKGSGAVPNRVGGPVGALGATAQLDFSRKMADSRLGFRNVLA